MKSSFGGGSRRLTNQNQNRTYLGDLGPVGERNRFIASEEVRSQEAVGCVTLALQSADDFLLESGNIFCTLELNHRVHLRSDEKFARSWTGMGMEFELRSANK